MKSPLTKPLLLMLGPILVTVGCQQSAIEVLRKPSPSCEASETDCADKALDFSITEVTRKGSGFSVIWENVAGADSFELVVSTDDACDEVIIHLEQLPSSSYVISVIEPGYYICVYAHVDNKRIPARNNPIKLQREDDNNTAPTLDLTFAATEIPLGHNSLSLTFAPMDPDDDAKVALFYKTSDALGCDTSGIGAWTQIVNNISENTDTAYAWDTSALAAGNYAICGKIADAQNDAVYALAANSITINAVPTIAVTTPSVGTLEIGQTDTYDITWTDSDADNTALIKLYYKANNSGVCTTGTLIVSDISEDDDAGLGVYNWAPSTVASGTYYICARIDDGVNAAVDTWSGGQITVNAKPTFAWVTPSPTDINVSDDTIFTLEWTDSDPDDDADITIKYASSGSYCAASQTTMVTGISEDSATNTYDWDVSTIASGNYHFCGRVNDSANTEVAVASTGFNVKVWRLCVWTGAIDNNWHDPDNWSDCNNGTPTRYDQPTIPSTAANQPTITSYTPIAAIGEGTGGGTITVAANANLSVGYVKSDIIFKGDSTTCTTCSVSATEEQPFYIINDATMELKSGIRLSMAANVHNVSVGTSTESGHLLVNIASADENEWPVMTASAGATITVQGSGTTRSTLAANGLRLNRVNLSFTQNYYLNQFDNIRMGDAHQVSLLQRAASFANCLSDSVVDTTWSNIQINYPAFINNIDISACNGVGPITISGVGVGYGAAFELDANNVLNWTGIETAAICTWNGSVDTSWTNEDNWDNCTNGRSNYPDHFDSVIIPVGPNQPVITDDVMVQRIAADAGGGGTVTINTGKSFRVWQKSPALASSVNFQGDTASCTTCRLYLGHGQASVTINNNATLGLGTGVRFTYVDSIGSGGNYRLYFGDGVTPGHLKTIHASSVLGEWPYIGTEDGKGLVFNGSAADKSEIDVTGLRLYYGAFGDGFFMSDHYRITNMNSIRFMPRGGNNLTQTIYLSNCNNSDIASLVWNDLYFPPLGDTTSQNISASDAGCAGQTPISISGDSASPGYGATQELDPYNILNWP